MWHVNARSRSSATCKFSSLTLLSIQDWLFSCLQFKFTLMWNASEKLFNERHIRHRLKCYHSEIIRGDLFSKLPYSVQIQKIRARKTRMRTLFVLYTVRSIQGQCYVLKSMWYECTHPIYPGKFCYPTLC